MERQNMLMFDKLPADLEKYLSEYGYHFTSKLAKQAVRYMRKKGENGKMVSIEPWSREEVEALLKRNNVTIDNDVMDDVVYVANMLKADCWKGSITTEQQMAMAIKEILDDADQRPGHVFVGWYAKSKFNGHPVDWNEVI